MISSPHGLFVTAAVISLCASECAHAQDGHADSHERHTQHAKQHDDGHGTTSFTAKHIKKQATITLDGDVDIVWPLFDPLSESKWVQEWQPEFLYPADGTVREGIVFRTHGELVWVVTRHESDNHRITYTVGHTDRVFTVDVRCREHAGNHTDATISYSFVGLTDAGNRSNEHSAERLFKFGLKDWQKMINHYLKTGKAIDNPHGEHGDGHPKPVGH